ncbi:MAG: xanthine dehydrogenase family protein molybdopterin-binding subunit [Azospirillaceae bacterium]
MFVGKPLRRREDVKFVSGRGRFVDDLLPPRTAHVAFVRSPHAHARIVDIDVEQARQADGVLRVLTAEDWDAAGHGSLVCVHPMPFSDGRPMNEVLRPAFATKKVCHVGDIVAAVIAETKHDAVHAGELVEIDYEVLAANVETGRALDEDCPIVHEVFDGNLVNDVIHGDREATSAAFAEAAHVTSLTLVSNRLAAMPLEPRAYLAEHDAERDETTLWATAQMPHMLRQWICRYALHLPEHKLRVIAPDVGGGFGVKGNFTPEIPTIVWMARELGRPMKWTCSRSEALQSDSQGRDHVTHARMAFDADGHILGLEVETLAALGAYLSNFAPSIPGNSYPQTLTGLYRTRAAYARVRGVYTNTVPIDAYRGSGRPEATLVNERLLENGAREMGIDVVEMRRRNLLSREDFPYKTPIGRTYDSGDPPAMLEKLLAMADYDELRREQARLRAEGRLMGIGLAVFLDKSGTGPSKALARKGGLHGGYETACARVNSDGGVTLFMGTHSHGQGHDITYAAIAADRLGLDIDAIEVVEGDTGRIAHGNGTWGSRSVSVGGAALHRACGEVLAKAHRIAAHLLEVAVEDLRYEPPLFTVPGSNRSVSFAEVADVAYHGARLPADHSIEPGLESTIFHDPDDSNDPSAMHLAVVEVDPRTGRVAVRRYVTVDDCGTVINPMIVEGQVHGGLAQGLGQALMENVVYDPASGQLLSGTFMDYAMPRAGDMPRLDMDFHASPTPSNALGAKGGSETGTIGPPAAITNAIVDALWHLGVRDLRMPLTPARVWGAIAEARDAEPEHA